MALSKGDRNAFADGLALTMDASYEEFRLVAAIMLYGAGSGVLGVVSSVAGNVITLADNILPANWFYEGMKVDIYDSDESTPDAGVTNPLTVTDVDLVNRKVTVSSGTSIDATDRLILASGLNKAFHGLLAAVDDSTYVDTYMNIQRSAAGRAKWKSYVDANGTPAKYGNTTQRSLTTDLIQKALDQQRVRAGAARAVDQFISSLGVRRAYWNSLSPDRRFNNTLVFDGGWEQLRFTNGDRTILWFADELAPRRMLFGLHFGAKPAPQGTKTNKVQDEEQFALYEALPAEWDDATGSQLKQVYSSGDLADAVGAFMKWYANAATCRPNTHLRIDDISEA